MRELLETHRMSGNVFPLIGGHRGCTCSYQENSIQAMEEGIRRGADYLEIDIQLTKDRIPIVFHDIDVEPKTGLKGLVQDHTYREMVDAYHVPTLREVLQWGKKTHAFFALELKSMAYLTQRSNLDLVPLLNGIVREEDMLEHVEAFGVDYTVLAKLHALNPHFDIGLIVPFVPRDPIALMRGMDAMVYLTYVYNITPEMVEKLQFHGYYVSGAILEDQALIHYAVRTRVDMFEHNHPGQFQMMRR